MLQPLKILNHFSHLVLNSFLTVMNSWTRKKLNKKFWKLLMIVFYICQICILGLSWHIRTGSIKCMPRITCQECSLLPFVVSWIIYKPNSMLSGICLSCSHREKLSRNMKLLLRASILSVFGSYGFLPLELDSGSLWSQVYSGLGNMDQLCMKPAISSAERLDSWTFEDETHIYQYKNRNLPLKYNLPKFK